MFKNRPSGPAQPTDASQQVYSWLKHPAQFTHPWNRTPLHSRKIRNDNAVNKAF